MVSLKDRKRADSFITRITDFMGLHPKTTLVLFGVVIVVIVLLAIRF